MTKIQLKSFAGIAILAAVMFTSCEKDNTNDGDNDNDGQEVIGDSKTFNKDRWITLTTTLSAGPDGTPPVEYNGNGGTYAYAIKHADAINPNYTLDIYPEDMGYYLKSQRTARVQASADGQFLYNIQYTGAEGGVFNKYRVNGNGKFEPMQNPVNTAIVLGTSPRWVKAAEGIGVGVYTGGNVSTYEGEGVGATFLGNVTAVRAAIIDLKSPSMTNTFEIQAKFDDEWAKQGYTLGRTDVPILNQAKTKVFIGGSISKIDPTKPTLNDNGTITWNTTDRTSPRTLGTATLVVDYPSLMNPHFIVSENSIANNNSYRTMTQYVGDDGHVYQATATSGSQILRINKNTDDYDDYNFDLNTALGVTGASIKAWLYLDGGKGVVLYHLADEDGAYVALIDLNGKTARKIATDVESDPELDFGQHQNIGRNGEFVYLPLTPTGKGGNVYVLNWKTGEVIKGAKLAGFAFARFLGSY